MYFYAAFVAKNCDIKWNKKLRGTMEPESTVEHEIKESEWNKRTINILIMI